MLHGSLAHPLSRSLRLQSQNVTKVWQRLRYGGWQQRSRPTSATKTRMILPMQRIRRSQPSNVARAYFQLHRPLLVPSPGVVHDENP